ncbi:MAG: glycosyltransferase family 2 protein [Polyangiaceae bacterium]
MSWQEHLSVVIPAFNEEHGIRPTLEGLTSTLPGVEIIVVDDGSHDATLAAASAVPGVRVVTHAYNRGYGAALKTGMRLATRRNVAWFDADNEHRVEHLAAMGERIETERCAAIIGRRIGPSVSVVRSGGKFAIRMLARSLGVDLGKDLNCGLRVFKRGIIMRYAALLPDQFSASMTSTMILIERGHPVSFLDIDVNPRIGQSKVKIRDGFSTMVLVLRFVMLFAPLRIFFVPGLLLFLAGAIYGVIRALAEGRGVPIAGVLVAVAGLLSAMLGLVADQISQLRFGQLAASADALALDDVREVTRPLPALRDQHHAPAEGSDARDPREQIVHAEERRSDRAER